MRYIKHNALAGRADELIRFEDYLAFAPMWRDQIANVRIHETTRERPIDRFQRERSMLHALPAIPYDTDEIVPAVVTPHARIEFDGNRYSVPPSLARRPVSIRADRDEVRILHEGRAGGSACPLLPARTIDRAAGPPPGSAGTFAAVSELCAGTGV